jgi:(p)ppGpp synthase/HD superfamily hydrolase
MFADEKHAGQKRMFSGEPYIVHPLAVADLVEASGANEAVIAAAMLHDVIEDCGVSPAELAEMFSPEVAGLVVEVTNKFSSSQSSLPKAERKALERARLAKVSPNAMSIKVADIIDNCSTLEERSPEFAKVYMPEKAAQLAVLGNASPILLEMAGKIFAAKG